MDDESEILHLLKTRLAELDLEGVVEACHAVLRVGIPPYKAVKEGTAILEPQLRGGRGDTGSRVVLGSVQGDIHDIGKNIVATLLTAAGFEVIDLGTDVAASDFVAAVHRTSWRRSAGTAPSWSRYRPC